MNTPSKKNRRLATAWLIAATAFVTLAGLGCSSSDDTSEAAPDAATACSDLCTGAGYSGSSVDVQPHETNCFCTGGTTDITAATCTDMCTSLGKQSSQPFKSMGTTTDSCQCS